VWALYVSALTKEESVAETSERRESAGGAANAAMPLSVCPATQAATHHAQPVSSHDAPHPGHTRPRRCAAAPAATTLTDTSPLKRTSAPPPRARLSLHAQGFAGPTHHLPALVSPGPSPAALPPRRQLPLRRGRPQGGERRVRRGPPRGRVACAGSSSVSRQSRFAPRGRRWRWRRQPTRAPAQRTGGTA
jgi:hypothetical protein